MVLIIKQLKKRTKRFCIIEILDFWRYTTQKKGSRSYLFLSGEGLTPSKVILTGLINPWSSNSNLSMQVTR